MTHKEDSPMLLQPTPAKLPPGAPPETEAQRLTAEITAENKHLKRLERQLETAC